MPIQFNITQATGAVATYHTVDNVRASFGGSSSASAVINSYLNQAVYAAGDQPLGSLTLDISPLVQNPIMAAPSLLAAVEAFLMTIGSFAGGMQVS